MKGLRLLCKLEQTVQTVTCSGWGELAVLKAEVEMQPSGDPIGERQLQADQIRFTVGK